MGSVRRRSIFQSQAVRLLKAVNRMTGQLRKQRDQIVAYSHDMERQVGERTAELASANEQLNRMIATLKDRHEELEKANLQLGQAIEKANLMAVEAEQASAAKGDFLANMSHEIRTPMTAILGYTDLASDPALSPSDRDNYLAVIRRNGEHLLALINDILDISKIEAGKFAMDVQPCSLPAVIADVTSLMRVRAEQRGILLSVDYETEIPEIVHTDGARVRQALVNLAGNAIKFTERGGVLLAASFLPAWRDGQPAMQIKVTDTGLGISEENLAQLFHPFVQADASTSRKFGGSGLGLAISRHMAELLGGELTAESTVGKGSTFTLTIPMGSIEGVRMLKNPAEAVHGEVAGLTPPAPIPVFVVDFRVCRYYHLAVAIRDGEPGPWPEPLQRINRILPPARARRYGPPARRAS
jgi:signal transduction histidine kinase